MLYEGQTISLALDTDSSISGYTGTILYKKPNGVTGSWSGTITDDTVSYTIQPGDTAGCPGFWDVQAKAVSGTIVKFGKITIIEFGSHL